MGGRSAKFQKQIFPRSRTKMEVLQDKLTGRVPAYPSAPASSNQIQVIVLTDDVDPEGTPQYSNLLKNVAGNIQSSNDNFRFKEYSMNHPPALPDETTPTPPGYLDKDMLTKIFISEKGTPDLHTRVGLTEEELELIYSCYSGYKVHFGSSQDDLADNLRRDSKEPPLPRVNTPEVKQQMMYEAEMRRKTKMDDNS